MEGFVTSKRNPRWLWHAIDLRRSGQVLTYVFGRRKDQGIFYAEGAARTFRTVLYGWLGAYDHVPARVHEVGKEKPEKY